MNATVEDVGKRWIQTGTILVALAAAFTTVQVTVSHLVEQQAATSAELGVITSKRAEEAVVTARMEERLNQIHEQIQGGILPGAQGQIQQLRGEILLIEERNGSTLRAITTQVDTLSDRARNLADRIQRLDERVNTLLPAAGR